MMKTREMELKMKYDKELLNRAEREKADERKKIELQHKKIMAQKYQRDEQLNKLQEQKRLRAIEKKKYEAMQVDELKEEMKAEEAKKVSKRLALYKRQQIVKEDNEREKQFAVQRKARERQDDIEKMDEYAR